MSPRPPLATSVGRRLGAAAQPVTLARRLAQVRRGGGALVVGPWLSEVGFELLYWIPFVRRALRSARIGPERVVVVSRGGAACWYDGLADRAIDVLDIATPEEIVAGQSTRVAEIGVQKHLGITSFDRRVLDGVRERLGEPFALLHPQLMYNRFSLFWGGLRSPAVVRRATEPARLTAPATGVRSALPDQYVAVKAYFSEALPAADATARQVAALVDGAAATMPVVALSVPAQLDDHSDVHLGDRVIDASPWMTPRDNLAVQTDIVAGARALIGTYGGFSYLGPLLGIPTLGVHSAPFNRRHLDVMSAASRALGAPALRVRPVSDPGGIDALLSAGPEAAA